MRSIFRDTIFTMVGCLVLLAGGLSAFGQETRASLGGRVTDPSGAVIARATVTVTAEATGVTQTAKTSNAGDWRIQYLLPGTYHFEVSATGFKSAKYKNLDLQVNDLKTIDTHLELGAQTESINVESTTPLIDTTAAVSGTVITSNEMMELPSLSNAPSMMIGLTPGATSGTGNSGGVYLWSNIGLSETEANGTGANSGPSTTTYSAINYKLDGGADSNNTGQMAFSPPLDAVGEFKVVTNAFDASLGRTSGATITLMSKTGSKDFHGDAYQLRLDHAWNNSNHSYVSLRENHWKELSLDPFGPTFLLNGYLQTRINKGITIDHTVVLNQKMLLDLNYNVLRYVPTTKSASSDMDPTALGFSSNYASQMQKVTIPLIGSIIPGAEKSGLGTNEAGNTTADTNQDLTANITHTYKDHTFRYGAEFLIQQEATGDLTGSGGTFTFGTNWTNLSPVGTVPTGSGSALASFMLGLPTAGSIPTTANGFWSQHYVAYYFQDDWRVNKKLTLNLGLRWDYQRPVTERFNRYAYRFDPNYVVTGVTSAAQANYTTLLAGSSANNTGVALLQSQRSVPPRLWPKAVCCTRA